MQKINKLITRFNELRLLHSNFEDNGTITNFKYKHGEKTYKPLTNSLKHLDRNFNWLIPIVTTRKKIYDVETLDSGEVDTQDVATNTTDNYVNSFMELVQNYRKNNR